MKIFSIIISIITIAIGSYFIFFNGEHEKTKTSDSKIIEINGNSSDKDTPNNNTLIKDNFASKVDLLINDELIKKNKTLEQKGMPLTSDSFLSARDLSLITILSLFLAFLSISVSLYLYYWRAIIINNTKFLIPDKLAKEINNQTNEYKTLKDNILKAANYVASSSNSSNNSINDLKDIIIQFQKSLNEKDNLISRYQNGYDTEIFKSYIGRFFKVYKSLVTLQNKSDLSKSDIEKIQILFDDAFEQTGVELFSPRIGSNYIDEAYLFDDNPIVKETDDENQDNNVVSVNSPGLQLIDPSTEDRIILKAKVTILKFKKGS